MATKQFNGSDYYNDLDEIDKKHYKNKLTLSDGSVLPDPWQIDKWTGDLASLPDITYGDVWEYLVETPSEFTGEKMKCFKSLEAYKYFVAGHVQDIAISKIGKTPYIALKTEVLPSQRQGQKQQHHKTWVILRDDGIVLSANCTCMAGLASACSHVAALLFKCQNAVLLELNKTACTSKECEWNKSRKQATPMPLANIKFKKAKKSENFPTILATEEPTEMNGYGNNDPAITDSLALKQKLLKLHAIAPEAAVFTSVSRSWLLGEQSDDDELTDSASETDENSLPEPLTSLFQPTAVNKTPEEVLIKSFKSFKEFEKTSYDKQYKNLEQTTKKQSSNPRWALHRVGRITASVCKDAYNLNIQDPSKSFLEKKMSYSKNFSTKATVYGIKNEKYARTDYICKMKNNHTNFKVADAGLIVNTSFIYMGASPDGIVSCDCHEPGLVEIKCPYKYSSGLSKGWLKDKNCPVNSDGMMKKSHSYYFQMQLQLLVTGKAYVDFFVWSNGKKENDTFLLRVEKDADICKMIHNKLELVFYKVILPELYTRKSDPNNKKENQLFCSCRRPHFNPMIACDGLNCKVEWFHYACVNLKRAPNKNWYCPDCKVNPKGKK